LITVTYDDPGNAIDFEVEDDLTQYTWDSVGITHLTAARGGTGWDSASITGLPVINAGTWGSSSTLPIFLGRHWLVHGHRGQNQAGPGYWR